MIKVVNLDKYFNKGKQNSIHVIDKTSLEFPKTGLVTLLGSSGSGKTTLLNVIGGLDKANGEITFDDITMKKYESKTWDKLRANNIGYIFQNYYLLESKTVYDNIKLTLNMIGIVDHEEVDYRITYVLNAVGMFRYRKKLASDLSGGQKQRVAIARALAKNPDVIIADEPTGNLDTNNSIEVLKIIKEISKEKLVVLVTHNVNLAKNYSDRIISITDGKVVNDEVNDGSGKGHLDYVDNNIYLQDLNHFGNDKINVYSDKPIDDLELTIVKVNNNYYLKTNNVNVTIENLNNKSNIELINDKRENVEQKFTSETDFSLSELDKVKTKRIKKKTFTFKDSVIEAFKKLANLGRRAKIQIIALIMLGIMFSVSGYMLLSTINIDTSVIYVDKNVYRTYYDKYGEADIDELYNNDKYFIFNSVVNANMNLKVMRNSYGTRLNLSFLPIKAIENKTIYPSNDVANLKGTFNIIIDESVLEDKYVDSIKYQAAGINDKKLLIGEKIVVNSENKYDYSYELTIVGTVNTGTKAIYMDHDLLTVLTASMSMYYGYDFLSYEFADDFQIVDNLEPPVDSSVVIIDKLEVYVSEALFDDSEYLNRIKEEYTIKGFFKDETGKNYNTLYMSNKMFFKALLYDGRGLYIYSYDGSEPYIDDFSLPSNLYDFEVEKLIENKNISIASNLSQIIISLVVSALIFFFLVRSSLTKRIKEISILRSLGVGKTEVRNLYLFEYIILTTFTSIIGVLIGTVISKSIGNSFLGDFFVIRTEPQFVLIVFLGMYLVNVIIALIPVNSLLRKTPATMLTNYDM
ncbi:MAG: ABC transporter ATP-binding protein/permease [Acholeplasma sp.]|nr:ABC transporter ATP-binding protein/permease [Acholeplasma sp.]